MLEAPFLPSKVRIAVFYYALNTVQEFVLWLEYACISVKMLFSGSITSFAVQKCSQLWQSKTHLKCDAIRCCYGGGCMLLKRFFWKPNRRGCSECESCVGFTWEGCVLHCISYAPISIRLFQQYMYVLVRLLQLGYVENTPNKYRGKKISSQLLCVLLLSLVRRLKNYYYKRFVGSWGGGGKLHKCLSAYILNCASNLESPRCETWYQEWDTPKWAERTTSQLARLLPAELRWRSI